MGQLSNILDGRIVPHSVPVQQVRRLPLTSNLARLIPGERALRQESESHRRDWVDSDDFSMCCASLFTSLWLFALLCYLQVPLPSLPLVLSPMVSCVLVISGRKVVRALAVKGKDGRNVLAVGSGALALKTIEQIYYGSRRCVKHIISGAQFNHLCTSGDFGAFARENFLDEVLILSYDVDLSAVIAEARRQRLDVTVAFSESETSELGKMTVERTGRARLLGLRREPLPVNQLLAKRAADVVLSVLALVALLPLMLIIAAVVGFDSKGPIFYRSQRAGLKGRKFRCYKFRTMIPNADATKEQLRKSNERSGAFFKISDDPRITRVGKFLRRYSLDELPQLWNVLRGDMSLVGPRPHPPDDLERYGTHHLRRLDFMPGITGLWQVTARRDPSFEKSVALDVEYIRNWSLWLDLRILWRTVGVVLSGSGV